MPWLVLLLSAVFEAVWATALGMSDGFRALLPTVVFAVAAVISMLGLGWAAKHIPIGTAYAVWTGVGAALTVGWAMATGTEAISTGKIVFMCGIIGAVIGLKLVPSPRAAPAPGASDEAPTADGPAQSG
ncbi:MULTISPECIES: multidrug efflux SMR transporter [Brevibacterium]|uniref:Multidrug efflux SMR transporter n=1 Tax=Brevibacterium pityocampae TaxID=506594 RepID=A0ABP8J353_9MICO|nr:MULTISPECIES: multidrug efflux SMR transporter [Actinomycetes]MCK1801858.1 multidrug efflux SMR transporter [Brevibacterium sp. R8603A2]MCX0277992.1 multidrug efflux SMR transporter [Nocardia zapadnayensis]QCP04816.1 multidrug efflux SMR transporter [Brevibacterium sp. CS2]